MTTTDCRRRIPTPPFPVGPILLRLSRARVRAVPLPPVFRCAFWAAVTRHSAHSSRLIGFKRFLFFFFFSPSISVPSLSPAERRRRRPHARTLPRRRSARVHSLSPRFNVVRRRRRNAAAAAADDDATVRFRISSVAPYRRSPPPLESEYAFVIHNRVIRPAPPNNARPSPSPSPSRLREPFTGIIYLPSSR